MQAENYLSSGVGVLFGIGDLHPIHISGPNPNRETFAHSFLVSGRHSPFNFRDDSRPSRDLVGAAGENPED